jgi:hypothetical protein
MKCVHLDRFDREVTCTYRGETYRVRDNGAVLRRLRDRARRRPLDEKWTFGRANKKRGYMHVASIDEDNLQVYRGELGLNKAEFETLSIKGII